MLQILRALVTSVPVPIDAKIRLLATDEGTYSLVAQILETGISALTVHCRTQEMRSSEPALLERLKNITEMGKAKGIPVIANGDCFGVEDQKRIEDITGKLFRDTFVTFVSLIVSCFRCHEYHDR